jgi:integrase
VGYALIQKLEDGRARYRFDEVIKGKRCRKQVTCLSSLVKDTYHEWVTNHYEGIVLKRYKFFEKLDEYILWVRDHKTPGRFQFVNHSIVMFKRYYPDMYLNDIRRHHIEDFISWRKNNPDTPRKERIRVSTVNRDTGVISCFFNWCIEREYYHHNNPAFRIKISEHDERNIRLSQEQIYELLTRAEGKLYTAILLAISCGLRRGEIIGLKWSDIDFEKSIIHLPANITKGQKIREVYIPDPVLEHLQGVRKDNQFAEHVIEGWNYWGLKSAWDRFRVKLSFCVLSEELGKIRLHDLRHVYAQSLRDAGVPLQDIQILLGHSSVVTTESRYAMFGAKDIGEKVNRLCDVIPFKRIV